MEEQIKEEVQLCEVEAKDELNIDKSMVKQVDSVKELTIEEQKDEVARLLTKFRASEDHNLVETLKLLASGYWTYKNYTNSMIETAKEMSNVLELDNKVEEITFRELVDSLLTEYDNKISQEISIKSLVKRDLKLRPDDDSNLIQLVKKLLTRYRTSEKIKRELEHKVKSISGSAVLTKKQKDKVRDFKGFLTHLKGTIETLAFKKGISTEENKRIVLDIIENVEDSYDNFIIKELLDD